MKFIRKIFGQPETTAAPPQPAPAAPVNIWDLDVSAAPTAAPSAPAPIAASRTRRTKTRLIGFDTSDGGVVDLFSDSPQAAKHPRISFPVGWVVVIAGPGRGASFALSAGLSQIGRGEDQTIALDFGDTAISRTNHAAIVYDPASNQFLLGHGGKTNLVRLNDQPVVSNMALKGGDIIRIGDTSLRFVALCDAQFAWPDSDTRKDDDVAFA